MNEEIKEILNLLKYCVEKNEYLEVPNMKEWNPLLNYITNLQEENQKLNKIIDELEKWLEKEANDKYYGTDVTVSWGVYYKIILNKLTELKKEVE